MNDLRWPRSRGDRSAFAARFGADRAERFLTAFYEGDPHADALFASETSRATTMRQLRAALTAGTASADDPPEVTAFIADMTASLSGVDWDRMDRGRRIYLSIPMLAHSVALGPGSLTNTYASPAISSVLVRTGRLVDGALRRLTDTRNWSYHLYFPDALQPGNGGFEHTGMVRAMHAFSRAQHLSHGGGTEEYGTPINAIDMLRTWFDFTYVPYRGLRKMGYGLSTEEIRDVYYFWQTIGGLLGIPSDLRTGLDDHASSEEMLQVPLVAQRYEFLKRLPDELEKEIATNEAVLGQLLEATEDGQSAYESAPSEAGSRASSNGIPAEVTG